MDGNRKKIVKLANQPIPSAMAKTTLCHRPSSNPLKRLVMASSGVTQNALIPGGMKERVNTTNPSNLSHCDLVIGLRSISFNQRMDGDNNGFMHRQSNGP